MPSGLTVRENANLSPQSVQGFMSLPDFTSNRSKLSEIRMTLNWRADIRILRAIFKWTEETEHLKKVTAEFDLNAEDSLFITVEKDVYVTVESANEGWDIRGRLETVGSTAAATWFWEAPKGSILKWRGDSAVYPA